MNNNEKIAVLKTMASTFESVIALLPENLDFTIDSRSASEKTRISVYGPESRKFVRGIGGKVGKWYGDRSQQRTITAQFNGIEVTAFETTREIKRDKRVKASADEAIAAAQARVDTLIAVALQEPSADETERRVLLAKDAVSGIQSIRPS